ncbi:tetratricopeptide repeat protein [Leptolyngbya sp. 7M]|uniref:tetratricopeptide repeat protein n=1 Tax=Leptolyngbya sp. 7M TaxID=2812896 RepID=UPI001B8AA428|nr:tetratricopeptide repeat protein [Leptolyngbya sp. 7M]QYO62954.1 tetratricopeptide repeat protein [Leptolyngbya sp. 7M]
MNLSQVFRILVLFSFLFSVSSNLLAQVDEVREITGLPIAIGQPVIYGRVVLENFDRNAKRPIIFVSLVSGGTQIERRPANSSGHFYFMRRAVPGATLVLEIDGMELQRAFLTPTGSDQIRQDFSIDWRAIRGGVPSARGNVISAKDSYKRTTENQTALDKAMRHMRDGKNSEAIAAFEALLAKDPNDHHAWMLLGTLYMAEKKTGSAEEAYKKALALKPALTSALLNYGRLEMTRKSFEKAIELLLKAVEAEPNSADANHFLGESYLQIKKGSLAVGYLNKAIELAPIEKAELHLRLAALYNGAGLKDRAAEEYKKFLEKINDHPERKKFEQYIKENSLRTQ